MTAERRSCPVCGSDGDRREVHRQRFTGGGAVGEGYDVVVCGQCGAGFADNIPRQEQLDQHYENHSKYEYPQNFGAESPFDSNRFELIVQQILPYLGDKEALVLDIGCATGGLLACLARRGFSRLLGSDPSEHCARLARELYGIDVRTAALADLERWESRFDCIFLVGVLEHLHEVQPALRTVTKLLKPLGRVYCAQPDVEAFADCVNAPYQQFSTEHVNYFSELSLARLMASCGLAPLRTWRWMVEWREGIMDSVVSGVYVQSDTPPEVPFDTVTLPALLNYLVQCAEADRRLNSVIEALVKTQEPLLVWGVGTHTQRLLSCTRLAEANIVAFVDSNRHWQGRLLMGRLVLNPDALADRKEKILVSSQAFQAEIVKMIREKLGLTNEVLTFYL